MKFFLGLIVGLIVYAIKRRVCLDVLSEKLDKIDAEHNKKMLEIYQNRCRLYEKSFRKHGFIPTDMSESYDKENVCRRLYSELKVTTLVVGK